MDSTGESKLFGVSIRSWNATVVIVMVTATLCAIAFLERDNETIFMAVLALLGAASSGATGFLFGKASGVASAKEGNPPPDQS